MSKGRCAIVTYPKTGSTWLRFMIANIVADKKIDFHTMNDYVGDYHAVDMKDQEYVKTHESEADFFERYIHLVRDPFDTMESLWHYMKGTHNYRAAMEIIGITCLEDMVLGKGTVQLTGSTQSGMQAYAQHTDNASKSDKPRLLVTYEILRSNPLSALADVLTFFGIPWTEEDVCAAVDNSSFKNMEEVEANGGKRHGDKNFKFMRKGAYGTARADMTEPTIRCIEANIKRSPLLSDLYGGKYE